MSQAKANPKPFDLTTEQQVQIQKLCPPHAREWNCGLTPKVPSGLMSGAGSHPIERLTIAPNYSPEGTSHP
jgi:hypothetical protein